MEVGSKSTGFCALGATSPLDIFDFLMEVFPDEMALFQDKNTIVGKDVRSPLEISKFEFVVNAKRAIHKPQLNPHCWKNIPPVLKHTNTPSHRQRR